MITTETMAPWAEAAAVFHSRADLAIFARLRMPAWAERKEIPQGGELAALRFAGVPNSSRKTLAWCRELGRSGMPCDRFAGECGLCDEHEEIYARKSPAQIAARQRYLAGPRNRVNAPAQDPCRPCKRCGMPWNRQEKINCPECRRRSSRAAKERKRATHVKLCRRCREPHPVPGEANCPKCTTDKARWYRENKDKAREKARERARQAKAKKMHERRLEYAADD